MRRIVYVAVIIASCRVAIFWWLFTQLQANSQSISLLPLVLVLYPEGLLVPHDLQWTVGNCILFSALLVVGTIVLVGAAALLVSLRRRLTSARTRPN